MSPHPLSIPGSLSKWLQDPAAVRASAFRPRHGAQATYSHGLLRACIRPQSGITAGSWHDALVNGREMLDIAAGVTLLWVYDADMRPGRGRELQIDATVSLLTAREFRDGEYHRAVVIPRAIRADR